MPSDTSKKDKEFVLSHFPISELLEMGCSIDPEGTLERAARFLNRRLAEAIVEDELLEKKSEAFRFMDNLP